MKTKNPRIIVEDPQKEQFLFLDRPETPPRLFSTDFASSAMHCLVGATTTPLLLLLDKVESCPILQSLESYCSNEPLLSPMTEELSDWETLCQLMRRLEGPLETPVVAERDDSAISLSSSSPLINLEIADGLETFDIAELLGIINPSHTAGNHHACPESRILVVYCNRRTPTATTTVTIPVNVQTAGGDSFLLQSFSTRSSNGDFIAYTRAMSKFYRCVGRDVQEFQGIQEGGVVNSLGVVFCVFFRD